MNRIFLVLIALGMAACKAEVGEESAEQQSSSIDRIGCTPRSYEELSEYGWGCRETLPPGASSGTSGGSGSTSGSGSTGGTTTGTSHTANITHYAEYEPNSSPENANPVAFPAVSGNVVPGIEITGSVRTATDESDYFILTPNTTGDYAVYLCEATCMDHPTDSKVAIRVTDQFGELVGGNPLYEESTKIFMVRLDAGMPYYVEVVGFDTQGEEYPYRLVVID